MNTSLYVLRNDATTTTFRHDTLDDALDGLNYEVGERDLWVLFELDRISVAARRVAEGRGTPAPVAPTERLVVGGLYRYVRNPMYLAVVAVIIGQGLALGQPVLLGYAAAVWLTVASFVRWYEEPTLARRFGAQYQAYRRAVPAWRPRVRPWHQDQPE